MNIFSSFASIIAGVLAVMMTVVSWRALHDTFLGNPIVSVCVGILTFIGLRYRPGGLFGMILLSYEAVAISILFLLLWMGFKKVQQNLEKRRQGAKIARQSSQLEEGQHDLQKPKTQSQREIQKRED
ncbi:MAG: hypothetical protein WCS52_05575 [bacterium]